MLCNYWQCHGQYGLAQELSDAQRLQYLLFFHLSGFLLYIYALST